MAVVKLTAHDATTPNVLSTCAADTAGSTDGVLIPAEGKKTVIKMANTGASDQIVTFKAGDGIQGVADLPVSVAAGKSGFITLDSGAFEITSGENKGYILAVPATATITFAVANV